jgi:hypothetical protein
MRIGKPQCRDHDAKHTGVVDAAAEHLRSWAHGREHDIKAQWSGKPANMKASRRDTLIEPG